MKTADAVMQVAARLAASGIDDARREARVLLAASLQTTAAGLLSLTDIDMATIEPAVARRAAREPLAYISGRREFWGLTFAVSPATLIPRPDSETLIEAALTAFPERAGVRRILDLGTGTGCLLLAALHEFPASFGVGIDASAAAIALAAGNAAALGFARRAAFAAGHWGQPLAAEFDLILCNPPYITRAEMAGLMPEVAAFEPATALCGGIDGLDAYREIFGDLTRLLTASGIAVFEIGAGQGENVGHLAAACGFAATIRADLAGQPRAATLKRARK